MADLKRRHVSKVIVSALATSALGRSPRACASGAIAVADVTAYGADPTGSKSSVAGFESAYNALLSTGGELYVPPGLYLLDAALTFSGAAITLRGEGPAISILKVAHAGVGVAFSPASSTHTVSIRNIGFAAVPTGAPSSVALSISMPNSNSSTPSCHVENVDFFVGSVSTAAFVGCLYLNNVWRSHISNVSSSGLATIVSGSYFVLIDGLSVDLQIEDAVVNQVDTAYLVANSSRSNSPQGIHISNSIVGGCNVGFSSGNQAFAVDGFNVLGLYIKGGEFFCNTTALNLYQVNSCWISDTHFGVANSSTSETTCQIVGSNGVQMTNCQVSGQAGTGSGPTYVGIAFSNLAVQQAYGNVVDSCLFVNLNTAVVFGPNVQENSVLNIRMINPANFPHYQTTGVAVDNSTNTTNQAIWLTGLAGTARFSYLR